MNQPTEQQIEAAAKHREQAIKEVWPIAVPELFDYAVEQRARVLETEEALKRIIERYAELEERECTKHDFYCCIDAARAVLKPKQQKASEKDSAVE